MKSYINITFLMAVVFVVLQSSVNKAMRSQGAEPGHSGSPGDGFKDCTACHGGSATLVPGWITSNIPSSGYVPGERYTITTSNLEPEGTRFGFQVSPQNIAGDLLGTLIITDPVQTQLVGENKYVTYTENGIDGVGSKTWTFDWIAPEEGTGEVIFYGAYNSNFEGHKGENHVFLSRLTVQESGTNSVFNAQNPDTKLKVFPNPAQGEVVVELFVKTAQNWKVEICNSIGQEVVWSHESNKTGLIRHPINTSHFKSGIYFVRVWVDGVYITEKLTVIH